MKERLQKVIAQKGIASRRQAESLIQAGRIQVNGKVVTELGTKVDPAQDQITFDGNLLSFSPPSITLLLNKPAGVLATCSDPQGRKTVLDLLPDPWRQSRLYPVGRLDLFSTGALLLTNDGNLALSLTHPRYHLPKTYWVEVLGNPSEGVLQQWREGVNLEEGKTLPAAIYRYGEPAPVPYPQTFFSSGARQKSQQGSTTWLAVVLREGRKRQIRRVAQQLGHPVCSLQREAIGSLCLGNLGVGECRLLTEHELSTLRCESQSDHGIF
jgi:pseudouridine synthase